MKRPECGRCQDQGRYLPPGCGPGELSAYRLCDCPHGDSVRAGDLVFRLAHTVAEVRLTGNGTAAGNACLAEFARVRAAGYRHAAMLLDCFRVTRRSEDYSDGEKAGLAYASVYLRELAEKAERGAQIVEAAVPRKEVTNA